MTRRRRKAPKAARVGDALIVIAPSQHVVERTAQAIGDARQLAAAKRTVERALIATGLPKRQACAVVAGMHDADLHAEADRIRAATAPEEAPEAVATANPACGTPPGLPRLALALNALSRWPHAAGICA